MTTSEQLHEADLRVRDGIRQAADGRPAEAAETLRHALETAPAHALGRLHLGIALADAGDYEAAVPHLERALELAPNRPAFHLFAGRVHFDAEAYAAARTAFERARELSPENDLVAGYLELTAWASGDRGVPMRLRPDALPESTPFMARTLYLVEAELKGRSVDFEDPTMGRRLLDRLQVGYALWRAANLHKAGRFEQALASLDMVLEMLPGLPAAVRMQKVCREGALQAAARRVEEAPGDTGPRLDYAVQLAEAERYAEAAEVLQAAESPEDDAPKAGETETAEPDDAETPEAEHAYGERKADEPKEVMRLRARIAYGLDRPEEALRLTEEGAEPGFAMLETNYMRGLCHTSLGSRRPAVDAFAAVVAKLCWAVPLRLREYQAWRRQTRSPETPSASDT